MYCPQRRQWVLFDDCCDALLACPSLQFQPLDIFNETKRAGVLRHVQRLPRPWPPTSAPCDVLEGAHEYALVEQLPCPAHSTWPRGWTKVRSTGQGPRVEGFLPIGCLKSAWVLKFDPMKFHPSVTLACLWYQQAGAKSLSSHPKFPHSASEEAEARRR